MKSLVAVVLAVVGVLLAQSVANARTALFMSGTQSCVTNPGDCNPTSTPTEAEMRGTLPELFAGDTLVGVTTPAQLWPLTGLNSKTFDASVTEGLGNLHDAIETTDGDKIVFGISQSATIVAEIKRDLRVDYLQDPTSVPDRTELSFVVEANPNRPHSGIAAHFPGAFIPFLGLTSTGAAPETPYDTIDVARQYDLIADFPQYPLNLIATANAVAGFFYIHPHYGGIDLSEVPSENKYEVTNQMNGTTTYYLVPTPKLPLLQPLRDLGVPSSIVDPLNAALKPIVEAGYDRDRYRPSAPATDEGTEIAERKDASADNKSSAVATDLTDGNKAVPGATITKRRATSSTPLKEAEKHLRASVEHLRDTIHRPTPVKGSSDAKDEPTRGTKDAQDTDAA